MMVEGGEQSPPETIDNNLIEVITCQVNTYNFNGLKGGQRFECILCDDVDVAISNGFIIPLSIRKLALKDDAIQRMQFRQVIAKCPGCGG